MSDCIFCRNLPKVMENELAYVVYDIKPITKGHALIIPKRHFDNIFEATAEEFLAIRELLIKMRAEVQAKYQPDACNIWVNCGKDAGQIVMHAHLHLIPRYKGEAINIKEHTKGSAA